MDPRFKGAECAACLLPTASQAAWDEIPDGEGEGLCWGAPCCDDRARQIARAAPEMARVLLAIEWSASVVVNYDEWFDACPACMGTRELAVHHRASADGPYPAGDYPRPHGHAVDCALVTTLRKAGVLETE